VGQMEAGSGEEAGNEGCVCLAEGKGGGDGGRLKWQGKWR